MPTSYLITVIARLFQIAGLLVTIRLATARLTKDQFGTWDLILRATNLAALILISPAGNFINRRLHAWHERGLLSRRLRWFVLYTLCLSATGFGLTFVACWIVEIHWAVSTETVAALIGFSLFVTTMNGLLVPSLNLLERKIAWAIASVLTVWSSVGWAWYLTKDAPTAAHWQLGMLLGMGLGSLAAAVPFIQLMRDNAPVASEKPLSREHFASAMNFMLPVCLVVGLNWAQFQSYRFVLGSVTSLAFLGVFAVGYAVSAGVFGAFESTAQQVFLPAFYRLANAASNSDEQRRNWVAYASAMIPMSILTAITIAALADVGCAILIAPDYREVAWKFVLVGAIVECARVIGNVYSMAAHATMNTWVLVVPQLIGATATLALLPILVHLMASPAVATALSLGIAGTAYVLAMHIGIFTRRKIDLNREFLWAFPIVVYAVAFIAAVDGAGFLLGSIWSIAARSIVIGAVYILCALQIIRGMAARGWDSRDAAPAMSNEE